MKQKILLIQPPFYRLYKDSYGIDRYPISLGYLSGVIKKKTQWDVMVYVADFLPGSEMLVTSYLTGVGFDNYLSKLKDLSSPIWQEVKSVVSEYKPNVVGISVMSANFTSGRIIAKIVKGLDNKTLVIMGGPHASAVGREILDCSDVDICVRGEGEEAIIELLNAVDNQKRFNDVKGIIYKEANQMIENSSREPIKDLDSLPFPTEMAPQTLRDYNKYPKSSFRTIFAIRGCPYNCFFCGSRNAWGRKVRFRSPENIAQEIKVLQKLGLQYISFEDDIFGINKDYISKLCEKLKKDCLGLKWGCEMHVKLIDDDIISLMRQSGCERISVGIESGNDYILKKIRKEITIKEAMDACRIIKRRHIYLTVFFIVGFPDETESTLRDTFIAMKKIKCDNIIYSIFTPYPGTEAFEFCKNKGLIGNNYDIALFNHQSPCNCFCKNIEPEKFRFLVSQIEQFVDRKKIRKAFTPTYLMSRVREYGLTESFRKAMRFVLKNKRAERGKL